MIDNLKKSLNNNLSKVARSVSKETGYLIKLQKDADTLLSTIKTKHVNTNISDSQLQVYRKEVNKLISAHNRINRIAVAGKKSLDLVSKIVSTLTTTLNTLSIVVNVLQTLPIPSQFSTIGAIMIISNKLGDAAYIIKQIKPFLNSVNITLKVLLEMFNGMIVSLTRLYAVIQEILALLIAKSSTFTNEFQLEMDSELNDYLNPNTNNVIGTYKDYVFILKIEDDPEFNIGDIRRKYAVATLKNTDVYFSDRSYTLNPEILIDQLKLQIDKIQ